MTKSKIEWTEITWNPTTGCSKISNGCKNCYAEKMATRLNAMGVLKYKNGFNLTLHPNTLEQPYRWKNPRTIFVNSMSDLFHEDIPIDFIKNVFKVMNDNQQHIFQVLTKRAEQLYKLSNHFKWTKNIWMGVTVEDRDYINRINFLQKSDALTKFISIEPLLNSIGKIDLSDINWVIVGGESGSNAREMKKEWVNEIKEQCVDNNVPFFFKQWGGINKKRNGRLLEGKVWDQTPIKSL